MRVQLNRRRGRSKKLLFFLLLTVALLFLNQRMDLTLLFYLALGFYWPYTLYHPDSNADVNTRYYRFSLLRIIFIIDNLIPLQANEKKKLYIVLPFILFSIFSLSIGAGFIWPIMIGSLIWYLYASFLRH
jgi:hypothetical protein